MFYSNDSDIALRFGDIVRGFVSSVPSMAEPDIDYKHPEYSLALSMPQFCVVMSPCCSIGDATITLTSLVPVTSYYFRNPYFAKDLTNINRVAPAEKTVPPEQWESLSSADKKKRLAEGYAYAFTDLFIYAEHENLPTYKIKLSKDQEIETSYYQIDFRRTFRVDCSKIQSKSSPIETRILQLSVDARRELREKISHYYFRAPQEDLALLNAQ